MTCRTFFSLRNDAYNWFVDLILPTFFYSIQIAGGRSLPSFSSSLFQYPRIYSFHINKQHIDQ